MSRPEDEHPVGYRNPPQASRFRKGRSGNPRGRPRGKHRDAPHEAVLGQMMTIREDGQTRQVSAAEAFLTYLAKRALEGDGPAARVALQAIDMARAQNIVETGDGVSEIIFAICAPGSVTAALDPLRMGRVLDPYRASARMMLEPWIVEQALARPGARRLTREEQAEVLKVTRMPTKVGWPDWWVVLP